MRWFHLALAALVEWGFLYWLFSNDPVQDRVCSRCSTRYAPVLESCPYCGKANPNVEV